MFVSGLLLAAGSSTRFGSPKMLALVDGEPLVRRVARAFFEAGLDETVIVLGAHADDIRAVLAGLPFRGVVNERWETGMFTSVKAGLAAVDPRARRIAISPADLPGLSARSVRRVVDEALTTDERTLVVPSVAGRRGHPLVLPAALLERVLSWPDSGRLSGLFHETDLTIRHLTGFDAGVIRDADIPEDLVPS